MTKRKKGSTSTKKNKTSGKYDPIKYIDSSTIASYGLKSATKIKDIADRSKTWEYILLIIFIPLILVIVSGIIYLLAEGYFKSVSSPDEVDD